MNFGRMARGAAAAVEFTTMPVAGAFAGHYIDLYLGTDPALTVTMCVLGFVIGTIRLTRELSTLQRGS